MKLDPRPASSVGEIHLPSVVRRLSDSTCHIGYLRLFTPVDASSACDGTISIAIGVLTKKHDRDTTSANGSPDRDSCTHVCNLTKSLLSTVVCAKHVQRRVDSCLIVDLVRRPNFLTNTGSGLAGPGDALPPDSASDQGGVPGFQLEAPDSDLVNCA